MWIYWKNECQMCLDRDICPYRKQTENYKKLIASIPNKEVYGSLSWKCDYFILDEKEYNKQNPPQSNG